jgi:O-antigen ligase
MPFGLGEVRANGVGRYAVIVLILALVSLAASRPAKRLLWLPLVAPALFVLMQTQSRTALLGLAVAGMLFVVVRGVNLRFLLAGPVAAYAIWMSGFTWRARGDLGSLVFLTGRETTWQKGLAKIGESPFFGWGFHADRILLDSQHMHNSYLHAGIQAGVIGALLFAAAVTVLWTFLWKSGALRRIRTAGGDDRTLLTQAALILGFLTSRSFFESTAAFYGVDLLLFVPAVCYIYQWALENPAPEP